MTMPLSARQAERRLLVLTATRWLPVGLTFGLTILLPLERGISLAQVGLLLSIQGFVVLGLELPSGGFSDAFGRRPVLVASGVLAVVSTALFLAADSFWGFAAAILLQGVFRALDSGPLEAWYVDAAHAADADAPIDRALSRAAGVLGMTIALGALIGGGIVSWHPFPEISALALPFGIAIVIYLVHTSLIASLVTEPPRCSTVRRARFALETVREVPAVIRDGFRLIRRSRVLRCLVLVEVFWSIAMIAFEMLMPVQLAEILGSEQSAGALFGPVSAAAWALFAAGSVLAGLASRRIGVAWVAILARIFNGLFVVTMGLSGGLVGLIAGYWLAYLTHGSAGPMHNTLLHRQAQSSNRATVLSINSMMAGGAYSLGLLLLTPLADTSTTAVAVIVAGGFSIIGAILYLPALRQERDSPAPTQAT